MCLLFLGQGGQDLASFTGALLRGTCAIHLCAQPNCSVFTNQGVQLNLAA